MSKELIEKLKDKDYVRAFGLMSYEIRETYRQVGSTNCDVYTSGRWLSCYADSFHTDYAYAIKPGYITHCVNTRDELVKQRDDLLEALKQILSITVMAENMDSVAELQSDSMLVWKIAKAAIAEKE